MSGRLCLGSVLVVILACSSCARYTPTEGPYKAEQVFTTARLEPGWRPASDTVEAGLWMVFDRAEAALKTSGYLVSEVALNTYVQGIVCKLAGSYCPDVRVYLVRVPEFNAWMAPNGVMAVWSGLLLRVKNEAQLAAVLGHELAHYTRRHSIQRWLDARSKANVLMFAQIALGAAGFGIVGDVALLATLASIQAYSRNQEREADDIGLRFMVQAGYDPRESPKVWDQLIRELDAAEEKKSRSIFFASHPEPEERRGTESRLAESLVRDGFKGDIGRERLLAAIRPHRANFLRDELHFRRFSRLEALLAILLEDSPDDGELHFFQGELYRLRHETGDYEKALAAYRKALDATRPPPELFRSLGLIYMRTNEMENARDAFVRYLELQPEADDRDMIRHMMLQRGWTLP